jgi:hypothetical protein
LICLEQAKRDAIRWRIKDEYASLDFLQAPATETAENRLLVQFQGMIVEYERAKPRTLPARETP